MIQPNEIAEAANRIFSLQSQAMAAHTRSSRDPLMLEAMAISCDILTRLADDDIYYEYEFAIEAGDREALRVNRRSRSALKMVAIELSHLEGFLERERALMADNGFDGPVLDILFTDLRDHIERLPAHPDSAGQLKRAVVRFQRHICRQRDLLLQEVLAGRRMHTLIFGLGGLGMVSVNLIAGQDLSPIGTAASAELGGALVVEALKTVIEQLWNPRHRRAI